MSCPVTRRWDWHSHPQRQDEVDPRARPRSQRRSLSARESRALPQARTRGHTGALPPRRLATEVSVYSEKLLLAMLLHCLVILFQLFLLFSMTDSTNLFYRKMVLFWLLSDCGEYVFGLKKAKDYIYFPDDKNLSILCEQVYSSGRQYPAVPCAILGIFCWILQFPAGIVHRQDRCFCVSCIRKLNSDVELK